MRLAVSCRTVIPGDEIFNSHRTTIIDALPFTIVFKLVLMRYFTNVYIFDKEMFGSYLRRHDVMQKVVLHPSYKMEISRMGKNRGKHCRVCRKGQSRSGSQINQSVFLNADTEAL